MAGGGPGRLGGGGGPGPPGRGVPPLAVVPLLSGCVASHLPQPEQTDVIGDNRVEACARRADCLNRFSGVPAHRNRPDPPRLQVQDALGPRQAWSFTRARPTRPSSSAPPARTVAGSSPRRTTTPTGPQSELSGSSRPPTGAPSRAPFEARCAAAAAPIAPGRVRARPHALYADPAGRCHHLGTPGTQPGPPRSGILDGASASAPRAASRHALHGEIRGPRPRPPRRASTLPGALFAVTPATIARGRQPARWRRRARRRARAPTTSRSPAAGTPRPGVGRQLRCAPGAAPGRPRACD